MCICVFMYVYMLYVYMLYGMCVFWSTSEGTQALYMADEHLPIN